MGRKLFSCILAVALAVLMIPSASIAYAVESASDQVGDPENQQPAGEGEGGVIQPQSLTPTTFEKLPSSYTVTGSVMNGSLTNTENAAEGVEYTTSIEPSEHYVRPASQSDVSITVSGSPLAADKYTYDASTGAIAIVGDAVTGNIIITAACTAEVYTVTGNIANGFLEGEEQVTYGQAYTATAIPEPGHQYPDTITVTVDDTALTDGYSYSANSGAIEIQAVKITGPITITGECAEETYQVTHAITNGSFEGASLATYYHAYTGTIGAAEHYALPETITVTVIDRRLVEGEYEYSPETGALEVLAGKVVGPIEISAVCEPATYTVTNNIENGSFTGAATATYGLPYAATIAADGHYSLPASITVTVGGTELTDGYTYSSGAIGIEASKVAGDITITAACVADTYDVANAITNGSLDGDAKATYGQAYTATIKPSAGYEPPMTVSVRVSGTPLAEGDFSYTPATGKIEIPAAKVTGAIAITAVCDAATYPVQTDVRHGTVTGPNTATYGQAYTATASADTGYSLPAAISIAVGGTELTGGFAYDDQTGAITVNGDKITGTVVIAAVCTARTFTVDFAQEGGTAPLAGVVATYGSPMPAISSDNLPVREGYEFLGYWTEKNGQGTQYYHADGTSAHNWDKASPATLYANWTAHYGILEGAALTHQVGDGQACAVRINADIAKFLNVYVDGVLVDPANYDVTEGSTIVTYKQSYLDTLSAGVHSARYQFTDGYAGSTITIAAAEKSAPDGSGSGAETAKTGDSITMMSWLALICFISAAIACFALYRGKATPRGKRSR